MIKLVIVFVRKEQGGASPYLILKKSSDLIVRDF